MAFISLFAGTLALPIARADEAPAPIPVVSTDKPDYEPGEPVAFHGGAFPALADLFLTVTGNSEVGDHYFASTWLVTTDAVGSFDSSLQLDNMYRPVYGVTVRDASGAALASAAFTDDSPAAGNLDQCADGPLSSPVPCTGSAWQNGNLNSNQAHYAETQSVPYRIVLTDVPTTGINDLVIEYDIKHGGKNAIDYLTSFDRTETTADPCSGISPCAAGTPVAIPAPSSTGSPVAGMPTASFNALPSFQRQISIYNGAVAGTGVTYVSQGDLNAAQSSTRVQIQFTASDPTVVFAWGGHIAGSLDWGVGNSAGAINGSPYHMRFIELNGKGGNQDRSLDAQVVLLSTPQGALSGVKFDDLDGNGVKDPSDTVLAGWTINLTGPVTATTTTAADGSYSFGTLPDGTYTVCEAMQSGWAQTFPASGAACPGPTNGYAVTISNGAAVGGNDFGNTQYGSVTIDKVTDPSGDPQSFSFTLSGPTAGSASLTDAAAPATLSDRVPGAYTLTEADASPAWTLTGVTCTGVTTTPVPGGVSFTLSAGQHASCEFDNLKDPKLTVVKQVVNDDGGTLQATDFPLFIDGNPTTNGQAQVLGLGAHVVSEGPTTGYAQVSISGDCDAQGNVTLGPGEEKTCIITNDDIAPKLTLVKHVVNDNGGSLQVTDVPLFIDGNATTSGQPQTLSAGSHLATETNPTGYQASSWSGDCNADGSITLVPGDDKICEITDNDIAPKLTLVKHVVNDDGGSLQVSDVPLFIDGNATTSGQPQTLLAGSHTASETNPTGYAASSWSGDCNTDGSITLVPGDDKTCEITDNDIAPKLTLVKHVVNDNGGTLQVSDVPLFIDGNATTSGQPQTLSAGNHLATETNPTGYQASSWSGDCNADGSITLAPGDDKTCEITDNDMPGEIHGMKYEDLNGNGIKDAGEPGLANWTINLSNGTSTISTTTVANGSYAFTGLNTTTYTLTETQQAGWTQTSANPAPISLGLGQVVNGVNFGNFRVASISGYKWSDDDMSGVKDNGEANLAGWTIYVDLNGNGAKDAGEPSAVTTTSGYTITNLGPGTYKVCEVAQSGWSQVYPANGACNTVVIGTSGQTVTNVNFGNVNEHEGTIGLWKNWNRHNKYSQTQINGWLSTINAASAWLMTEAGYTADTTGMVNLINDATKYCSLYPDKIDCSKRKFLAQYMVNRLNVLSGRKSLLTTYNLSSFGSAMAYLGISPSTSVSLSTYFAKVEAKAASSPNHNQFLQMASVSDYINNQGL